jgi:hypothetical protein
MKHTIIESYVEKLSQLVDSCVWVQRSYEFQIKGKYPDHPMYEEFWKIGSYDGALIYFLRSLTEEEKKISKMVFAKIAETDSEKNVDAVDYMDAAVEVLDDLGFHIPIPEDI